MTSAHPAPLARVLAAPWQQRRNAGSLWGLVFIVFACSSFPIVLFALSVLGDPGQSDFLRHKAALSAWIGIGALLVVGWAMLVGNVLRQNHPALARLVPGHAGHLRTALLVAWTMLTLFAAAGPGFALDAPLAWACGAAAALAVFAAALRWPILWLGGIAAPFVSAALASWDADAHLAATLQAQWRSADWLIAAIVATAGSIVLAMVVRNGDARHVAAYDRWIRVPGEASQASSGGTAATPALRGCTHTSLGRFTRAYSWWLQRLLARQGSPVMARVLLGLGPATHWTTRFFEALCALAAGGGLAGLVWPFMGAEARAGVCAYGAMFVLIMLSPPAVQQLHRVWQTRREQALLTLLPGVPRGAVLNRWLGWQMSWPYLVTSAVSLAVASALAALAEANRPGAIANALGGMVSGFAVALLPLVALQWRTWARMREPGSLEAVGPVMFQMALVLLAVGLHAAWDIGYRPLGVVFAMGALAWCAWRWWRMGGEPTALPTGRLG
jgi:hypothetical protein